MIPTDRDIYDLWDTYHLPQSKRAHCQLVAFLSLWFAKRMSDADPSRSVNTRLLEAAALLHDIDKMAPKKEGERHPETAVRLLREHGLDEVADLVRTHALHAICDQKLAPKTIEQKLLFLSDKMVKHSIITVDQRFALWRNERLPKTALHELDAAYPKVKMLEKEICSLMHIAPEEMVTLAKEAEMSTMKLSHKGGTV